MLVYFAAVQHSLIFSFDIRQALDCEQYWMLKALGGMTNKQPKHNSKLLSNMNIYIRAGRVMPSVSSSGGDLVFLTATKEVFSHFNNTVYIKWEGEFYCPKALPWTWLKTYF